MICWSQNRTEHEKNQTGNYESILLFCQRRPRCESFENERCITKLCLFSGGKGNVSMFSLSIGLFVMYACMCAVCLCFCQF